MIKSWLAEKWGDSAHHSDENQIGNRQMSQKMLKGSLWSFGTNSVQQILVLARLVILAHLLLPSDFGLLGIAVLTIYGLDVFSQTGLQQALVQKKTDITSDLDAVWTLLAVRGVLLFIALFLTAPFIADFFRTPEAMPVLQVIGVSLIFQGLTNLGTIFFLKDLDFRKQFLFKFGGVLADFIVSVSAVFIFQNVWALVFGLLAKDLTLLILSYVIHPYRPRINFDLGKVRALSVYGRWILVSAVLVFLLIQGDDILVGRMLGVAALGFYQMAYGFSNTPSTEISQIFSQVAFPVYSKLQDDVAQLKEIFLKTLKLTALLSFLLIGFLVSLAPDFTLVFLGSNWSPIIPLIQILAWWGLIRGLEEAAAALFMAVGKPRIYSKLQFIQVVLLFALFIPLISYFGLVGVSIAVVLSAIPVMFLSISAIKSILRIDAREVYSLLFYPFVLAVSGIVLVSIARLVLFPVPGLLSFVLLLGIFIFGVMLAIYLLERYTPYNVWAILKSRSRLGMENA